MSWGLSMGALVVEGHQDNLGGARTFLNAERVS